MDTPIPVKCMNVVDKKTGEEFFAVYAANRLGNLRFNVNGKFYSDREFNKKFESSTQDMMKFRVHTVNLLKEVLYNSSEKMGVFKIPFDQFGKRLHEVAERASQLNDPILNALMCDLTLYAVADPESKEHDKEVLKDIYLKARVQRFKEENH